MTRSQFIISERENAEYLGRESKAGAQKFIKPALDFAHGVKNKMGAIVDRKALSLMWSNYKAIMTPAGDLHLAMAFGPLIFESGVPNTRGGVLVSPRPWPTLFNSRTAERAFIEDAVGNPNGRFEDCAVFYKDKYTQERGFYWEYRRIDPRSTLGSLKRVYGGAFSGYPDSSAEKDTAAIDCLVRVAEECKIDPRKGIASQQKRLQLRADELVGHIRERIGTEVTKYLKRIAQLLMDPDTKMSWSMFGNNCQKMVNRLLGGKDFEYSFPRLPPDFGLQDGAGDDARFRWPRYLISFGNHIEGLGISIDQPNSAFSRFFRSKSTDLDVVEYLEAAQQRAPKSFPNWLSQLIICGNTDMDTNSSLADASDALWELPRDAISLLQSHLLLPAHKYCTASGQPLTDSQWIENRLRILRLLDIFSSLTGGLGNALLSMFSSTPSLISEVTIPKSRIYGGAGADDRILLIKAVPTPYVVYLIRRHKGKLAMLDSKQTAKCEKEAEEEMRNLILKSSMSGVGHSLRSLQKLAVQCARVLAHVLQRYLRFGFPVTNSFAMSRVLAETVRYHEDSWVTIDVGLFVIAQQILRKTKNVRK